MRCLIVGNAKTGTTALLYAVAAAIGGDPAIAFEEPLAGLDQLPGHAVAKLIFEHEPAASLAGAGEHFDRRILLTRDPRDALVSRLLYMVAGSRALLGDLPFLREFAALLRYKQQCPAALPLLDLPPLREPSGYLARMTRLNRELAAFARQVSGDWFVLRYEDLVAGRLEALSGYLGCQVRAGAAIDPVYARVARTCGSGDWRNWFTPHDIARLRPQLDLSLAALGYPVDWQLPEQQAIAPEHSWRYFERLVHERRGFYGLEPAAADLFPGHSGIQVPGSGAPAAPLPRITKGDICNRLIRQCGFRSYLEYNKFDGASNYADVACADKTLAFQPETVHMDALHTQRMLQAAGNADAGQILSLPELVARYAGRRFDLIFFDPVHVRPDVDDALRTLPALLNPGGVLAVHDCNPPREEMTTVARGSGGWTGETYKAFALLRQYNPGRALTVAEDVGVGLVWNDGLRLDYPIDADLDYGTFARHRAGYLGLMSYRRFLACTQDGDLATLFADTGPLAATGFRTALVAPQPGRGTAVIGCQLFWRVAGADFAEAAALTREVRADGNAQQMRFVLPAGVRDVAQLRFDCADAPVALSIATMELVDPDGALAWTWDARAHAAQDWRNVRFHALRDPAGVLLLAASADPQYYPALPGSILARLGGGWVFRVVLTVLPPLVRQLLAELAEAPHAGRPQVTH